MFFWLNLLTNITKLFENKIFLLSNLINTNQPNIILYFGCYKNKVSYLKIGLNSAFFVPSSGLKNIMNWYLYKCMFYMLHFAVILGPFPHKYQRHLLNSYRPIAEYINLFIGSPIGQSMAAFSVIGWDTAARLEAAPPRSLFLFLRKYSWKGRPRAKKGQLHDGCCDSLKRRHVGL